MEFKDQHQSTLVEKYDRPVPRYTSYPTAAQFQDNISPNIVDSWLKSLYPEQSLSLYVHLPFCPSLCSYCGCNMRVTHSQSLMQGYLAALRDEITMVMAKLPARMAVSTLHLGGGTPTYYAAEDLSSLFKFIGQYVVFTPGAEISLEVDPRRFTRTQAAHLKKAGVNRVSLGVQDTNSHVQKAIGRNQTLEQTVQAFQMLHDEGIEAINTDLIYGLPLQTPESIAQTACDVANLRPSRLALYGYAHVPWMKRHQRLLEPHGLPDGPERMALFMAAREVFIQNGYIPVGIDHFALPDDPLVLAAARGELHRNFMGYTTDTAKTLLGFGVSAISSYPQGYVQNTTSIKDYLHQVRQKALPIWKGLQLTELDKCSAEIIEKLLCQFQVDIAEVAGMHSLQPSHIKVHTLNLHQMMSDGLVVGDTEDKIIITERGKPFARIVASCFDGYLRQSELRHSRL
ncbi:MAG: oxygen-independent coproporphyrinogen III oxidase [Pseudomonadaceae bacterium]|nr:oxygen-independent coproporphyrinogen III oxidase [Pseudomonadaceae bacterium]